MLVAISIAINDDTRLSGGRDYNFNEFNFWHYSYEDTYLTPISVVFR